MLRNATLVSFFPFGTERAAKATYSVFLCKPYLSDFGDSTRQEKEKMTPKELTKLFLMNNISLKEASRITGKQVVYVRQALTGHLNEQKFKEFAGQIDSHIKAKS